ncbi:hypothetical protein GBAR_LOCUS7949 [Geodia barretti]|uniref:Uncharacterized protein n=1 Tax=Geodia barretti TaxID=519541 RepID=A0AA35RLD7_GEOBA|nr:hypothetical protein GBAR_LOCUS7949 [Geodia barretti]
MHRQQFVTQEMCELLVTVYNLYLVNAKRKPGVRSQRESVEESSRKLEDTRKFRLYRWKGVGSRVVRGPDWRWETSGRRRGSRGHGEELRAARGGAGCLGQRYGRQLSLLAVFLT